MASIVVETKGLRDFTFSGPAGYDAALRQFDFVTPDSNIAIGSYEQATRIDIMRCAGFEGILNLTRMDGLHGLDQYGVKSMKSVPLDDRAPDAFEKYVEAVETLRQMTRECATVLLHCELGASRSPAVVIGYLMAEKGYTPNEAYAFVKAAHPRTVLDDGLWKLIEPFYSERCVRSAAA